MSTKRIVFLLCALALVAAACSDDSADEPTTSAPPATTTPATTGASPTTTPEISPTLPLETVTRIVLDDDTGQPVEVEEPASPPSTYEALLDAGVEAGLWGRLEGLELLLAHAVGAVPSDSVPGAEYLQVREFSHLLREANALSMSDEVDQGELENIRRYYEMAVPPPEAIEALVASAPEPEAHGAYRMPTAYGPQCAPIDPADFSDWAVVEGCYLLWTGTAAGATVRVLYPAWYDTHPELSGVAVTTGQAAVLSLETFSDWAPVGDVDIVFSATNTADIYDPVDGSVTHALANDDATWGQASRSGACPVSVFPAGIGPGFENTIAHEVWHCVQRESGYPRGITASWIEEGGAQYFANQVFPEIAWFSTFDAASNTTSLFDMSHEAWVWWQFLGNREGPEGVADLQKQMIDAGDGGRAGMVGRRLEFQSFVIDLVAGTIAWPAGTLPGARTVVPSLRTVSSSSAGEELELPTSGFVAARYVIEYDQQLHVRATDASHADVDLAMVENSDKTDPLAWRGVLQEVRSKCGASAYYIIAATAEAPPATAGVITIDAVAEDVCDPCIHGTWSLDLSRFEGLVKGFIGATPGTAIPDGADFQISGGAYYVAFGDQGTMQEHQDGLTITSSFQGVSLDTVINSYGLRSYTADGDTLELDAFWEFDGEVTTADFTRRADAWTILGSGSYECNDDRLIVTISDGTIEWDRVDRILEPPPLPGDD